MSAREDVITLAETEARESKAYFWVGGPGAVFVNAMRRSTDPVMDLADCGKTAVAPISCADYPLLLARLGGHLSKEAVATIFASYHDKFQKNKQSGSFSYFGYAMSIGIVSDTSLPKRGDLIFLSSGGGTNDCEHVMLATGNGEEAISFGNKHLDAAGATRRSVVNKTTITAMRQLYHSQFIKFCAPVWVGFFG
jgi:hypothetical protein